MTPAVYEDYLSSKEWECFLRGVIKEYARSHPMSIDERNQLLQWALLGNDIHSNPEGCLNDSGESMDYLDYLRSLPGSQPDSFFPDRLNAGVYTTASCNGGLFI